MKYCEEYALDLFVDGELPPAEMERVRAHLETCPGCRSYVDDALAIRAAFPDAEDAAAPEGFAEGVMERIRKDAKPAELKRRSARRRLGAFAALAACCALVVLARTGTGGLSGGSDSASMVAASAGAGDAPAGYAMDTGGIEESDDAWEDLQTAMEPAAAPEEVKQEEAGQIEGRSGPQMAEAEMDRMAAMDSAAAGGFEKAASSPEYEDLAVSPSAALPEASANVVYTAGSGEEAALYLTAEEAGGLLEEYTPVRVSASERCYELTGEEYWLLLEALGRPTETAAAGAPPATGAPPAAPVLVVVAVP